MKPEKLRIGSNCLRNPVLVGGHGFKVDRTGAVGHRVGMVWVELWATDREFTARAPSPEARIFRLAP